MQRCAEEAHRAHEFVLKGLCHITVVLHSLEERALCEIYELCCYKFSFLSPYHDAT